MLQSIHIKIMLLSYMTIVSKGVKFIDYVAEKRLSVTFPISLDFGGTVGAYLAWRALTIRISSL